MSLGTSQYQEQTFSKRLIWCAHKLSDWNLFLAKCLKNDTALIVYDRKGKNNICLNFLRVYFTLLNKRAPQHLKSY